MLVSNLKDLKKFANKFKQPKETRHRATLIIKEVNEGRYYPSLEKAGGQYTCAKCEGDAYPMKVGSANADELPDWHDKEFFEDQWVRIPYCFCCTY